MRKISEVLAIYESKDNYGVPSAAVGRLTLDELKKYIEAVGKQISKHTLKVVQYLEEHNDMEGLSDNQDSKNPLFDFYKTGKPKTSVLRSIYDEMKELYEIGRLNEIPVFMTRKDFNDIINNKVSLDIVVLDLNNDDSRNRIAKAYTPLVHKLARQWFGKINFDYDELLSIGFTGLTYAMNTYGKQNKRSKADEDTVKKYNFMQYAAYCIRNHIVGHIGESHIVSISQADMKKERAEKGFNAKSHTVSGDRTISKNGDDGSKTVFDFIDGAEDADKRMDMQDLQKLWDEVYAELEKHFSKQTMDIWYSFNGLNGHEKIKNKDICAKYNMTASNVTYYNFQVNTYIKKHLMNKMSDIYELMKECLNDWERSENDDEPIHISISENNDIFDD